MKFWQEIQRIEDERNHLESALAQREEAVRKLIGQNNTLQRLLEDEKRKAAKMREVVLCKDCALHGQCITEETFTICGIAEPFCCAGRKGEQR